MYGLLMVNFPEAKKDGSVALLRVGLGCDVRDNDVHSDARTFFMKLSIRVPNGPSVAIISLNIDPAINRHSAFQLVDTIVQQMPGGDITILVSNECDGVAHIPDTYQELLNGRLAAGFTDLVAEGLEKHIPSPWILWMKSSKYAVVKGSSVTDFVRARQEPQFVMASLTVRSTTAGPAGSVSIPIPMPRSAKTVKNKSPPPSNAAHPLSDPAVLSAEAAKNGGPTGTDIINRLTRPQKWKLSHSFVLKGSDTKLTSHENAFALSSLFATPAEAVEELNKNLNWPADYCIVQNTVLCNENAQCDRQALRRYARDLKSHQLGNSMYMAIEQYTKTHAGDKKWAKTSPDANYARAHREWSESCCAIVYQITPREKKFDITSLIGHAHDNLKKAIDCLNRRVKENNLLVEYPYDYALLFSVERQGYWLIAATHVPCDIVACRMAQLQ
ncbi:hypothetical protein STCU_06921 [Strigomonas culicis]|uniref:Uncharacterized protein n=1 Tax=Strigomonas culicis TaxID=28005 RepID=S9U810_9TRYP|nr:hypothetical protein STCU_06921 [Strigomonas culicis]|eukprot:EPY24954.1 hypothetical protein STCU_06921 [Strigomonas culicis]